MLWICCNKSPIEWRCNIPYFNCSIVRTCCNKIWFCICVKGRLFYSIDRIRVSLKWINKSQWRVLIVYFYLTRIITSDNCSLSALLVCLVLFWGNWLKNVSSIIQKSGYCKLWKQYYPMKHYLMSLLLYS